MTWGIAIVVGAVIGALLWACGHRQSAPTHPSVVGLTPRAKVLIRGHQGR